METVYTQRLVTGSEEKKGQTMLAQVHRESSFVGKVNVVCSWLGRDVKLPLTNWVVSQTFSESCNLFLIEYGFAKK